MVSVIGVCHDQFVLACTVSQTTLLSSHCKLQDKRLQPSVEGLLVCHDHPLFHIQHTKVLYCCHSVTNIQKRGFAYGETETGSLRSVS